MLQNITDARATCMNTYQYYYMTIIINIIDCKQN